MKKEVFVIALLLILPICSAVEVQELFTISGEEPVEEVSSGTFGVVTNFYSGNKLLATKEYNGQLEYQYQDRLGSDINTKTLPFGQEVISDNRFSFTGKELDSELYYFEARYYDPNLGRFTSVDPVKGNNIYAYVENNPMNYVDTSGRDLNDPANLFYYQRGVAPSEAYSAWDGFASLGRVAPEASRFGSVETMYAFQLSQRGSCGVDPQLLPNIERHTSTYASLGAVSEAVGTDILPYEESVSLSQQHRGYILTYAFEEERPLSIPHESYEHPWPKPTAILPDDVGRRNLIGVTDAPVYRHAGTYGIEYPEGSKSVLGPAHPVTRILNGENVPVSKLKRAAQAGGKALGWIGLGLLAVSVTHGEASAFEAIPFAGMLFESSRLGDSTVPEEYRGDWGQNWEEPDWYTAGKVPQQ